MSHKWFWEKVTPIKHKRKFVILFINQYQDSLNLISEISEKCFDQITRINMPLKISKKARHKPLVQYTYQKSIM